MGGLRLLVAGIPMAVIHNFAHPQSWAHNLVIFQWYYKYEKRGIERMAFLQMCEYFQAAFHIPAILAVIGGLLIFHDAQPEVLKYASVVLGLVGPMMLVYATRSKWSGAMKSTK